MRKYLKNCVDDKHISISVQIENSFKVSEKLFFVSQHISKLQYVRFSFRSFYLVWFTFSPININKSFSFFDCTWPITHFTFQLHSIFPTRKFNFRLRFSHFQCNLLNRFHDVNKMSSYIARFLSDYTGNLQWKVSQLFLLEFSTWLLSTWLAINTKKSQWVWKIADKNCNLYAWSVVNVCFQLFKPLRHVLGSLAIAEQQYFTDLFGSICLIMK